MADKKKNNRDDEGGKRDPAREARVKATRDRLSAGDDHGPISLEDGGKFYQENAPLSEADIRRSWQAEAAAPRPSSDPTAPIGQGPARGASIRPGENVNKHLDGDTLFAVMHALNQAGRGKQQ